MIDTLVKMSGTTHRTDRDQKTVTRDLDKMLHKNEGRVSYTLSTKEVPVIQMNDFLFLGERESIILRAGNSPIWNKRQNALPMSWRLFQNTIRVPGKEFTLQTIPTNSTAKDFDVRKNQPNFFKMLDTRLAQAKESDEMTEAYKKAYGITDDELVRLDQNVVADDIMRAIGDKLNNQKTPWEAAGMTKTQWEAMQAQEATPASEMSDMDLSGFALGDFEDNTELAKESADAEAKQGEHTRLRYAQNQLSRDHLIDISGTIRRQVEHELAQGYKKAQKYFRQDQNFRVHANGTLTSAQGEIFIKMMDMSELGAVDNASQQPDSRVYAEGTGEGLPDIPYTIEDAFIKYLATFESWEGIAGGHFDKEVAKAYRQKESA